MYGRVHIHAPLNTTRTWTRVEQVCSTRFVSRGIKLRGEKWFVGDKPRYTRAFKSYAHFLLTTFIRSTPWRWNHPLPVYACALAREHIPIQTAFG